jgi:hypothetical protein
VTIRRVYFVCRKCREGAYPLDSRLGIEGSTSRQAQRLMCLAGASWSFDRSSELLQEFCGLRVSDFTIRRVCQTEGSAIAEWQRTAHEARETFRSARGDVEFSTDGTSVNTTEGWREMRVGIFSKRNRGEPAEAQQWDTRQLPTPHVRVAFAAIENSERFGSRWGQWASRLGIYETSELTVLADGARWIWEEAAVHFAGCQGVLDIYHALEHVSEAAKALYGEGKQKAEAWLDGGRDALLSGGWPRMKAYLHEAKRRFCRSKKKKAAIVALENYLRTQAEHLNYPTRLAEGRSIGSGQAEGACKNMIGRRLKQTGARWRVRRVNRMAALASLIYSDLWSRYWAHAA